MYTFTSELLTGVKKIDEQHKEMFHRANLVHKASNIENAKKEIDAFIEFIEKYALSHFKYEEDLQIKYNYPNYKKHKAEHDGFVEFYRPLKKQYEKEGISYDFISNFDKEVMKWIVFHVKNEDLEMAKYIKKCRKTGK